MATKLFRTTVSGATTAASPWIKHESGPLSLQLVTKDTVAGPWKVEVSNKPNVENDGDAEAADITDGFETPGEDAIADAAGVTLIQYVQTSFLRAGYYKVTCTVASGAGDVAAYAN